MHDPPIASLTSQQALAKFAAGRGIRHGWSAGSTIRQPVDSDALVAATSADEGLSQLERNYANCVKNADQGNSSSSETDLASLDDSTTRPTYGFLSRNSSLVDLAMIPEVEEEGDPSSQAPNGLTFVDFPNVQHDDGPGDGTGGEVPKTALDF